MEGYIGEIKLWAGNWAPRNWVFCGGQTMRISENATLYTVIGNTFGGDGRVTFNLPDFSGRVPVGTSSFPHLGEKFGDKTVSLTPNNLPEHHHEIKSSATSKDTANLNIYNGTANTSKPTEAKNLCSAGSYDSGHGITAIPMLSTSTPNARLDGVVSGITATLPSTTENTGKGEAFYNYQPSLGINYIICIIGPMPDHP